MRGMGNMQQMMRKMQKMQKDMLEAQEGLKDQTVEGTVSGGMVTAIANGDGKILDIKIKQEVVDPEDIEMLQDLVLTAVNDALEKSTKLKEETLGKFTNGLSIPGLYDAISKTNFRFNRKLFFITRNREEDSCEIGVSHSKNE